MRKSIFYLLMAVVFLLPPAVAYTQDSHHETYPSRVCYDTHYQPPVVEPVTALFSEDFSGSEFPPAGWSIQGLGSENWSSSSTNNAGGTAPEAQFNWSPTINGVSRLVTPEIATSGYTLLVLTFKFYLDDYGGAGDYTLYVESTSDGGTTWNELWSLEDPGANVGPEQVFLVVDNDDVGSDNFQLAFRFDGNSYELNNWYIDDIVLDMGNTYDAKAEAILNHSLVGAGVPFTPKGIVVNMGTETVSFDVKYELLENGTTTVYSQTVTTGNLAAFETETLTFPDWTAVAGNYTAVLTTLLPGDENPDNDVVSKEITSVAGVVDKKPLYEEFTSSTCPPCANANEILDTLLHQNQGTHSLVKYQMDWPGSGDPYYIEDGGMRKDYYGVWGVPDMYINSQQFYPGDITQEIYDSYIGLPTAVIIDITTAVIDDDYNVTVSADISTVMEYPAGLKAHIAVVEKMTVGNVGTNGETEFYNVVMKMLPDGMGTTLEALVPGTVQTITETYDMSQTFMEQPNDLAVIVFVQDDSDKEVLQSEQVDITGQFEAFDITFNVEDALGNVVEGAEVVLEGNGTQYTNASGEVVFEDVFPGWYDYSVSAAGLFPVADSVEVVDQNVTVTVTLGVPNYYFYEDFAEEIPAEWTTHATNPDMIYWYDGVVLFFRQSGTSDPIMLVTPAIDLEPADMLYFDAGQQYGNPTISFGTIADPNDPDTYAELATYTPGDDMETFEYDLSELKNREDAYLAWKLNIPGYSFFYFDNVIITASGGNPPVFADDFEAYNVGEQLACQNPDNWTTWSEDPCNETEDPYISDAYAYSGSNSVNIVSDNDCVKPIDNYTSGEYKISFYMYIPTGGDGYWNTLQDFAGSNSQWGMQVYFGKDAAGAGSVDAGGAGSGSFTFDYDTWIYNELIVDLNNDWAKYSIDGDLIVEWQWSTGSFGTGNLKQLGGNNFYGWSAGVNGNANYYFDDYKLESVGVTLDPPENLTAEVVDEDIVLNWTAPGRALLGYNVYHKLDSGNFELIAYTEETTYTHENAATVIASHVYYVTAVYDEGESAASNEVTVLIVGMEEAREADAVQVYPNPATNRINIRSQAGIRSVTVYNHTGQLIETRNVNANTMQIITSSYVPGLYFLRIETDNQTVLKRFIIQ